MQNDLAKFNDLMDENRRLRAEVRRLRRALRGYIDDMAKHRDVDVSAWRVAFKSALAPRRKKK